MSRKLNIKLSNLYLDLHNPRYEEQRSQNEALNTIAEEQKDKLLVLLRDIIANGLNPSDIPIVLPDDERVNGYIVLEGNRRIAALKLFRKPSILTNTSLRQKYSKLSEKHEGKIVKSIECLVVDSREEANLWIERKHEGEMSGAGTVRWDNVQKSRFLASKTGKDSKAVQLIDFMKTATYGDAEFAEQLAKVSATNLERLISTPEVCSDLGLVYNHGEFSSKYEWEEVLKGLKAIVKRLSQDDFNVSQIYLKDDRLKFMGNIPPEELPDNSKRTNDAWKLKDYRASKSGQSNSDPGNEVSSDSQTNSHSGTGGFQRSTKRWKFIPDGLTIEIPNDRVNRIYSELKLLSLNSMTNTCAVMLRVFLELSADAYLEQCGLLRDGVLSSSKAGDLKSKINMVIKNLCDRNYLDDAKAKGIRDAINAKQGAYCVDTLNSYVHNLDFNPIPDNLMLAWDNIQPFVIAMWKAINDNKK